VSNASSSEILFLLYSSANHFTFSLFENICILVIIKRDVWGSDLVWVFIYIYIHIYMCKYIFIYVKAFGAVYKKESRQI